MNMRAFGYFREVQGRQDAVTEQNKGFLEFCEREGYDVAGTFVDDAASNGDGPGYHRLLTALKESDHEFTLVVVPEIERLGGDIREAARRYFQIEGLGARVVPVQGDDAVGALLAAWSAQEPGRGLGDRVRAAMRRKAVKGDVLGRPPYGYKVGNQRRLQLVAEEAVVVRYIFRLYLSEGMGIRLIARRLNQEGLRTRRGGNWSMVSIRDILRNRVYLGTYARFNVRVPGTHPPLVTAEDFRLVQDRLNARRTSYAPRVTSRFLLSGIAYCGYCENKLIGVSRRQSWKRRDGERISNSYRYYQCESRTNQSICGYHTRRANDLEVEVLSNLSWLLKEGATFPRAGDPAAVLAEQQRQCDRLRANLRAIDKRLESYVERAAQGRLQKDVMRKRSLAAATERLTVEESLAATQASIARQATAAERARTRERDLARLLTAWDELKFPERQRGIHEAVDRVTVRDDAIKLMLRP